MRARDIKQMPPSELAKVFFGVELPVSMATLKSKFRDAAKKLHSDVGGSDEKFIAMKLAYDCLIANGNFMKFSVDKESRGVELNGRPLSAYGLGLGIRKNGRDCESCNHVGYHKHESWQGVWRTGVYYTECYTCKGTGEIEVWNPVIPKWVINGGVR